MGVPSRGAADINRGSAVTVARRRLPGSLRLTPLPNQFGYVEAFGWPEQIVSILRCKPGRPASRARQRPDSNVLALNYDRRDTINTLQCQHACTCNPGLISLLPPAPVRSVAYYGSAASVLFSGLFSDFMGYRKGKGFKSGWHDK